MDTTRFNELRSMYPDWSEEKIWTTISIEQQSANIIDDNPGSEATPEFLRIMLKKAGEWLEAELPHIYERVADFFISILDELARWIRENLPDLLERMWRFVTSYFG